MSIRMQIDLKKHRDDFLFVPLGGSNEIGMNLNLYHFQGKWIMVDCGIGFADDYYPGVDIILPDISFIDTIRKDLLGLILTHAHEDHLGAVPYLWGDLQCPVYATNFASSVLQQKQKSNGGPRIHVKEIKPRETFQLGPFSIEPVTITHSIPEMVAMAITTQAGTVMHTGDWKLDPVPLVGAATDQPRLQELGDKNILAMVCDSTNVFVNGESGSEEGVREALVNLIASLPNRVAVTTFASNVARLESIIKAGQAAGRQIALVGRSLWRITAAAQDAGYLQDAPNFLDDAAGMKLPRNKVLFICTGCQGEPLAALSKVAEGTHPVFKMVPGDHVVFSSRMIPGNDKRISWMQNTLVRKGIDVLGEKHQFKAIHVSGHPAREELIRMYQWVRPKIAIPVHGEARHIHEHAHLAKSLGVEHTVEPENGVVIRLNGEAPAIVGFVPSGYVAMDGGSMVASNSPIFKTRRRMRKDGLVMISLAMDEAGELAADPLVTAPGLLDPDADKELIASLEEEISAHVEALSKRKRSEQDVTDAVRSLVRKTIAERNGKTAVDRSARFAGMIPISRSERGGR